MLETGITVGRSVDARAYTSTLQTPVAMRDDVVCLARNLAELAPVLGLGPLQLCSYRLQGYDARRADSDKISMCASRGLG